MNESSWVGVGLGVVSAIPTVAGSIWAAGAGHGSYLPAVVLFPFTMLSTLITTTISPFGMALALLQFPIYGFVIGKAPVELRLRLGAALAVIHCACVVAGLAVLKGGAF